MGMYTLIPLLYHSSIHSAGFVSNTRLIPPGKLRGFQCFGFPSCSTALEPSVKNRTSEYCEDSSCLCSVQKFEHMNKCSRPSGVLISPLTPCIRFSTAMWHQTQQLDLTNDISLFSLITYIESRIPASNRKETGMQCPQVPADLLSD